MPRQLLFLPGPVMVAQPVVEALALSADRPSWAGVRSDARTNHRARCVRSSARTATSCCWAARAPARSRRPSRISSRRATGCFRARSASSASASPRLPRRYGCSVEIARDAARRGARSARARGAASTPIAEREIAGVLLTHNETSTGVANDMAALAPILRAHGAITLVDSVSGLGASRVSHGRMGLRRRRRRVAEGLCRAARRRDGRASASARGSESPDARRRASTSTCGTRARRRSTGRRRGRRRYRSSTRSTSRCERYHAEGMEGAWARFARFAAAVRAALERARLHARFAARRPLADGRCGLSAGRRRRCGAC